jgi:hypothetical protein
MTAAVVIAIRVSFTIRRRSGRKTIVTPHDGAGTAPGRTHAEPALAKTLARAQHGSACSTLGLPPAPVGQRVFGIALGYEDAADHEGAQRRSFPSPDAGG